MGDNRSGPGAQPMFSDSELSALRAFVGGYLHEDFAVEHGIPAAALAAYSREATRKELLELESDFEWFLKKTREMDFGTLRELFVRELRSGWSPPNRAALTHLARMVRLQLSAR